MLMLLSFYYICEPYLRCNTIPLFSVLFFTVAVILDRWFRNLRFNKKIQKNAHTQYEIAKKLTRAKRKFISEEMQITWEKNKCRSRIRIKN